MLQFLIGLAAFIFIVERIVKYRHDVAMTRAANPLAYPPRKMPSSSVILIIISVIVGAVTLFNVPAKEVTQQPVIQTINTMPTPANLDACKGKTLETGLAYQFAIDANLPPCH